MSFLSAWYYTWNVGGITLGIDIGTDLGSLDGFIDGSNDGKLERLFLGDSLGYTDSKLHGSDKGIKLGIYYGKVLSTILWDVHGITLGIDVGTDLVSLDGLFNGSNDDKIEVSLHGDSLGYTDGKCMDLIKVSNLDLPMVKCLVLYLEMYLESHLGLVLEQSWVLL